MGFFHSFTKNKKKPLVGAQLSDSLYASRDPEVNILHQKRTQRNNNHNKNYIHFPRVLSRNSAVSSATEEQCDPGQGSHCSLFPPKT